MTNVASRGGSEPPPVYPVPELKVVPTDDGVVLSGEVDMATWPVLQDALDRVAGGTTGKDVILDVDGLSFIDGHGMRLLARAARRLEGSRLVMRGAAPNVVRMAEILGMDREPTLVIEGGGKSDG